MDRYYITDIYALPDPAEDKSVLKNLPRLRQEKCLWYHKSDDRRRCLGAGLIINEIAGKSPLSLTQNGKPFCCGTHFNVSHSGRYVIGIASDKETGCDIEYMDKAPLEVAEKFFYRSELDLINHSSDKSHAFWQLWTLKESYMKMTGEGMSLALDRFEVNVFDLSVTRTGIKQNCFFKNLVFDNHMISFCKTDKELSDIKFIHVN